MSGFVYYYSSALMISFAFVNMNSIYEGVNAPRSRTYLTSSRMKRFGFLSECIIYLAITKQRKNEKKKKKKKKHKPPKAVLPLRFQMFHVRRCSNFMPPPNLGEVEGANWFRPVRPSVCPSVTLFGSCGTQEPLMLES